MRRVYQFPRRQFCHLLLWSPSLSQWRNVPRDLQRDVDFARKNAHRVSDPRLVLRLAPALRFEYSVWQRILSPSNKRYCPSDIPKLLHNYAPTNIRSDKDIMLLACSRNPKSFQYLDVVLVLDGDFFDKALELSPMLYLEALTTWNRWVRRSDTAEDRTRKPLFRMLLKRLFQVFGKVGRTYTEYDSNWNPDSIVKTLGNGNDDFWTRHDMVAAWYEAGMPFSRYLPPSHLNDRQIPLLIAEHCLPAYKDFSFGASINDLCYDADFLLEAAKRDPRLLDFFQGTPQAASEFYFRVFASVSPDTMKRYSQMELNYITQCNIECLQRTSEFCREQHKVFVEFIVCVTSQFNNVDGQIYQLIRDFVGAPTRDRRLLVHRAGKNLAYFARVPSIPAELSRALTKF